VWRKFRIAILLLVLASVAQTAWLAKTRSVEWKSPLRVAVYPINGDGSAIADDYLRSLNDDSFNTIEDFIQEEAQRYGITTHRPLDISLAQEVKSLPPPAPRDSNVLGIMWWSLKLRFWVWRNDAFDGPKPQVRLFVMYFDPTQNPRLGHSLGLEKGLIGVVKVFAARPMAGRNNFVIAHELLHTLGATDKYDLATNLPRHPEGYAEPQLQPLHPQQFAEIMGGRVAVSETNATMPVGLRQTLIGHETATEINFISTEK